jgi:CTP:molybdopterin cytidylyltransferase MocA
MGVGGLLMEIVTRPQPRKPGPEGNSNIAAVILAAGRSTRMGGPNKLLADLAGKPMLRTVTERVLASRVSSVTVVTGHQAAEVENALAGLKVKFVRNPDFFAGLASSVKAGIAAVPANADGVVVCLGDMPRIDARLVDRLIEAFAPDRGHLIAVPVSDSRRGNPVLWSRRFFGELMKLDGDIGARNLIAAHAEAVVEVQVEGRGAFLDVDTPEALALARQTSVVLSGCRKEIHFFVMAGLSRPSTSYLLHQPKTWMPGSPGMPNSVVLSTSRSSSGNTPALACCPVRREGPLTSLMRLLWGLIIVVVPTLALAGILLGKEARATGANSRSANAAPTVKPMIIPARPARELRHSSNARADAPR